MFAGYIEQRGCAQDVRFKERHGVGDAAVHMTLCSEVHHAVEPVFCEERVEQRRVADVPAHEDVLRPVLHVAQVGEISGVGEQVVIHELNPRHRSQQAANQVRADEPSAASDQEGLKVAHGQRLQ